MICRTCGKVQEDHKMMGRCKFCTGYGKLIDERQYKLEQRNKCEHIVGWTKTIITAGVLVPNNREIKDEQVTCKFKYCPLCGNKTRFYTKEKINI